MKDAIDVQLKKPKTIIKVYDFMWRDLELKGSEILVYAYIHQFPVFFFTQEDMARIIGINIKTLIKILKELEVKRLIYKQQIKVYGNLKRNVYVALFKPDRRLTYEQAQEACQSGLEKITAYYKLKELYKSSF